MSAVDTLTELLRNPFFSGVVGASALAYLGYVARDLPKQLWSGAKLGFTCVLTVFSTDAAFERISDWLAAQKAWGRVRQFRVSFKYDDATRQEVYALAPGMGWHVVRFGSHLLFVHRYEPNGGGAQVGQYSPRRSENIDIWTWGRSNEVIQKVMADIGTMGGGEDSKSLRVFTYRQGWTLTCRKAKRALDSIVLERGQVARVIGDVAEFLESRAWYADRGVPYRRGYLLEGPPGCGKTSLAMAVASHYSRPIYALNLGSILSDDDLMDAVSAVPEYAVLLIEDIDATKVSAVRKEEAGRSGTINVATREVTLSALLNCIDGAFAREGRILFMTTNHPDRIDPALLRPGRTDRREHLGLLGLAEVAELCARFIPEPREAMRFANTVKVPVAAAELQEQLVQATRGSRKVAG